MSPPPEFYNHHALAIDPMGIDEVRAQPDFFEWGHAQTDTHPFVAAARLRYKDATDLYGWITTTRDTVGSGKLVLPMGMDGTPLKYPGLLWIIQANRVATGQTYKTADMLRVIELEAGRRGTCTIGTSNTEVSGVALAFAIESHLDSESSLTIPWKQDLNIQHAWLALSAMGIAKDIESCLTDIHVTPVAAKFLHNSKPPPGVLFG